MRLFECGLDQRRAVGKRRRDFRDGVRDRKPSAGFGQAGTHPHGVLQRLPAMGFADRHLVLIQETLHGFVTRDRSIRQAARQAGEWLVRGLGIRQIELLHSGLRVGRRPLWRLKLTNTGTCHERHVDGRRLWSLRAETLLDHLLGIGVTAETTAYGTCQANGSRTGRRCRDRNLSRRQAKVMLATDRRTRERPPALQPFHDVAAFAGLRGRRLFQEPLADTGKVVERDFTRSGER